MCYTIQQKATTKELTERFNAQFELPKLYNPSDEVKGFSHPMLPLLTSSHPKIFRQYEWGLIPHWAKSDEISKHTLNAKLETIDEKPSFRDVQENRCILPVTGFYEWKWVDSKGKRKEKYLINLKEYPVFGLAGLHSMWKDPRTGEDRKTFTLLTTAANAVMEEIHNTKKRMPLMLDIKGCSQYLNEGKINLNEHLHTQVIESDGQLDLF
jgi:putative SOS response-associated peptidase YedK